MKKIAFLIPLIVLFFSVSVHSQETKHKGKHESSATGTIKAAEFQGNAYLKLTLITSKDKKDILIWCSREKTRVYTSQKTMPWSELTSGRKIKVVGNWIEQEGERLLWASKIDLL